MDGMVATSEKSALLGAAERLAYVVDLSTCIGVPPYGALTSAKLLAHLIISDACLDMYEDRQTERLRRTIDTYALVVATGAFKTKTPTYRGIRGVGAAGRLRKHDDIAGKQPMSSDRQN
jgi:hypothetical protein